MSGPSVLMGSRYDFNMGGYIVQEPEHLLSLRDDDWLRFMSEDLQIQLMELQSHFN